MYTNADAVMQFSTATGNQDRFLSSIVSPLLSVRVDIFVVISPEKNRKNKAGKKACEKDRNQERNEEARTLLRT